MLKIKCDWETVLSNAALSSKWFEPALYKHTYPLSGVSTSPTPVITTAGAQCVDNYPDCPSLGSFYCTDTYRTWSMQNCRKYCNWCNRSKFLAYLTHSFLESCKGSYRQTAQTQIRCHIMWHLIRAYIVC